MFSGAVELYYIIHKVVSVLPRTLNDINGDLYDVLTTLVLARCM